MSKTSQFAKSRSGNFAMMFSILMLPVMGGVALAIDYTNLLRTQSQLQNATDSATVFAARHYEVYKELPSTDDVKNFLYGNSAFDSIVIKKLAVENNQVVIDSHTTYHPFLLNIADRQNYDVDTRSAAAIAEDLDLEVVMALDTTYSMTANNKIGGLKVAATNFANTLFDASNTRTKVKIGLVPFDQYVNVGLGNRGQSWMDVPADSSETTTTTGCRMVRDFQGYSTNCEMRSYVNDGVTVEYQYCEPIYGPEYETCEPVTSTSTTAWQGCVGTRGTTSNMLTLKDTMPSATATNKVKFPGIMNAWCARPLTPLTEDRTTIVNEIAAFTANGNTYIADGVMWGLRVLSPQAPFTEGADPATSTRKVRKIMILMTDGENQASPRIDDFPDHWGSDLARSDTWTKQACNYAKNKGGVEIFTVTFGTSVPPAAKNIMKKCAKTPANYYDAASADKLDQAFQDIANSLTKLRLTQ